MPLMMMINPMSTIVLLLCIAFHTSLLASINAHQIPTAYTTTGGGFITMTNSMGIIRSWYESNILTQNTTHSGCVSGGCWFQFQFSYSKDFYESAIGVNGASVNEFVSNWGILYEDAMKKATKEQKFENLLATLNFSSKKCRLGDNATKAINSSIRSILARNYFPANNWYFYIEAMLSSYIPNYNTSRFLAERGGFSNGIIVAGSALGPDIYDNNATLGISTLRGQPAGITILPAAFVVPEGQDGSWQYPVNESVLEVSVEMGGELENFSLKSLAAPLMNVVASATSADFGYFGSPTLFGKAISNFIETKFKNLKPIERKALKSEIKKCLPLGLQNVSSPTEGNVPSTVSSSSPLYRYLDGAYTEKTSIAHTIASMQKSCTKEPSRYDCSQGLRLLNVGPRSGAEAATTGAEKGIRRLFANCDCGNSDYDNIGQTNNPQLFAEEFQSDLGGIGWELYSTKVYDFNNNTEPTFSYAWRGSVTTVTNTAYGISAGMNVYLIIVYPKVPPEDTLISPGSNSTFKFSTIYAVVAEEQYNSTLSLFKKWNLSEDWGNALQTPSPTASPTQMKSSKKSSKSRSKSRPKKKKGRKTKKSLESNKSLSKSNKSVFKSTKSDKAFHNVFVHSP